MICVGRIAVLAAVSDQSLACSSCSIDDESLSYEQSETVSEHYEPWLCGQPHFTELFRGLGFGVKLCGDSIYLIEVGDENVFLKSVQKCGFL